MWTGAGIHMLPSDIERVMEIDNEDISNYDVDEFYMANLGYDWSWDKNTLNGLKDRLDIDEENELSPKIEEFLKNL